MCALGGGGAEGVGAKGFHAGVRGTHGYAGDASAVRVSGELSEDVGDSVAAAGAGVGGEIGEVPGIYDALRRVNEVASDALVEKRWGSLAW